MTPHVPEGATPAVLASEAIVSRRDPAPLAELLDALTSDVDQLKAAAIVVKTTLDRQPIPWADLSEPQKAANVVRRLTAILYRMGGDYIGAASILELLAVLDGSAGPDPGGRGRASRILPHLIALEDVAEIYEMARQMDAPTRTSVDLAYKITKWLNDEAHSL